MTTIMIQKINPGLGGDPSWHLADNLNLPTSLPPESRLEIHSTNDPEFPFEAHLIRSKKCTRLEAATQNQFVKILVMNHAHQGFKLRLKKVDEVEGGQLKTIKAAPYGNVATDEIRVSRDDWVNQIQIIKDREAPPPLTTNFLTRIFDAFCICLRQLLEKLRAWIRPREA